MNDFANRRQSTGKTGPPTIIRHCANSIKDAVGFQVEGILCGWVVMGTGKGDSGNRGDPE